MRYRARASAQVMLKYCTLLQATSYKQTQRKEHEKSAPPRPRGGAVFLQFFGLKTMWIQNIQIRRKYTRNSVKIQ
jgi:hypothetical protein